MVGIKAAIFFGQFGRDAAHDLVGGGAQRCFVAACHAGTSTRNISPACAVIFERRNRFKFWTMRRSSVPVNATGRTGYPLLPARKATPILAFLQGFGFGARPLGRDDHQPAFFHARQDFTKGGVIRVETVQPDGIHGAANGAKQRMILVFLRNGHNDVFAVYRIQQDGRIQPSQMVCRQNKIALGEFIQTGHFHIGDEIHDEADNGSEGFVFHDQILT